jgi:hypothetical protein
VVGQGVKNSTLKNLLVMKWYTGLRLGQMLWNNLDSGKWMQDLVLRMLVVFIGQVHVEH